MIKLDTFRKIFPYCKEPEEWLNALNEYLPKYDINTNERIAAFIAQCGHESQGWSRFTENLNYSAQGLNTVFPRYFVRAGRDANKYARQPEKIANIVYANRNGNGDTDSGDGWKFRGRGPIQITGKNNYAAVAQFSEVDVISNPDLLATDKVIGIKSAIWYWYARNLNAYADTGDMQGMTRKINGGYNGLTERVALYTKILNAIKDE